VTPAEIAALAAPLAASAAGLWRWATGRLAASEARYEARIASLEARLVALEAKREELTERWLREVRRGAGLAAAYSMRDATATPPECLPAPNWDERTEVRDVRALVERDELLRAYAKHDTIPPTVR